MSTALISLDARRSHGNSRHVWLELHEHCTNTVEDYWAMTGNVKWKALQEALVNWRLQALPFAAGAGVTFWKRQEIWRRSKGFLRL